MFTEVLEHPTANPVEILQQLIHLLKPNGYIYLSTPNFFRRKNRAQFQNQENPQEVYPSGDNNWDAHHHYREYGLKEMLRFIKQSGGKTSALYFSNCWDTEHCQNESDRGNMVFVIQLSD